eukprot:COSAG03_NODE_22714_length_287_cov_1.654255_1_plen_61_part_10
MNFTDSFWIVAPTQLISTSTLCTTVQVDEVAQQRIAVYRSRRPTHAAEHRQASEGEPATRK